MSGFICLFFPSFITLNIIKNRNHLSYKDLIIKYPLYNLIINLIVFVIIVLFKNEDYVVISENFNMMMFNIRYILLASIIAIIIPYIKEFLFKNIKVKLLFLKGKENNEK